MTVFFNLLSEADSFAAILIAHGKQVFRGGDSWGPKGWNLRLKAESWEGFMGRGAARPLSTS